MSYLKKYLLTNKVAVVTGALGILGRKFCQGLAEMGASVVVADVTGEVEEFAQQLKNQYGTECLGVHIDVANALSVSAGIRTIIEKFDRIDILHNNAASKSNDLDAFFADYEEYSLEQWREVMAVNTDGMFLMSQAVGKVMIEKKIKGSIIQTASIYGVVAPDQRIYEGSYYLERQISSPAVYSVSKAAVIGLTKYLAAYWGNKGIRVNCITPGGVESGQNETFKQNYSRRVPMNRMAQDEEIVNALLYLASDASSYVTGQNIIIDGGLSVW